MTRRAPAADRPSSEQGFTLVELVVSMVLIGVIFAIFSITMGATIRTSNEVQENSVLQGEVRAAVDGLAKDLRQAYTGNGNPGIERMLPAEIQFVSPDRQTPFHLRRVNYKLSNKTLQRASALSTNTGSPPWTFPRAERLPRRGRLDREHGRVQVLRRGRRRRDAGGRRRVRDDHAHRRQQDVAEPPVHLRDECRDAGGPMSRRLDAMRREDGVTMVLMVLVVALLGVVSLALLSSVQSESNRANAAVKRDAAFQAAEAGIHSYMSKLVDDTVFYNHYLAKGESTRRSSTTSPSPAARRRTSPGRTGWAGRTPTASTSGTRSATATSTA